MAVTIVEVGARDGLQNESTLVGTAEKVMLIERLVAAGVRRIETASFVHPRLVPQLADAEAVMALLGPSPDGVSYAGLVLNERGLDRALDTPVDEIGLVVAATDGFSMANQNAPVAAVMAEIETLVPRARNAGRFVSLMISVSFGCPFDGEVDPDVVVDLARRAAEMGVDEIGLGDTIGVAVPTQVASLVARVADVAGTTPVRCHFHDTRNTAVANSFAAYTTGVRVFDASVGGAGGCPFAPAATGNVATEDLHYFFERSGEPTGIDGDAVAETARWLGEILDRELPSALAKAGGFPPS